MCVQIPVCEFHIQRVSNFRSDAIVGDECRGSVSVPAASSAFCALVSRPLLAVDASGTYVVLAVGHSCDLSKYLMVDGEGGGVEVERVVRVMASVVATACVGFKLIKRPWRAKTSTTVNSQPTTFEQREDYLRIVSAFDRLRFLFSIDAVLQFSPFFNLRSGDS